MQIIYAADADLETRELLQSYLSREGYAVRVFPDGNALLEAYREQRPDFVILNAVMPKLDGLSACSILRREDEALPILLLSSNDSPYDRVTGLTLGCDDYMVKPFLPLELSARIRAILRRCGKPQRKTEDESLLRFGPLTLNTKARSATLEGQPFPLTPTEFDFLAYLIERNGAAVSREELLKNLWQVNWEADTRATDDLVKRLRRKLRERGTSLTIETVWGYGFRLSLVGEG
jgi:DNA-binding response OmpR family regulator